jgi:hypothetical protein
MLDLQSPAIRAALAEDNLTTQDAERLLQSVASLKVLARK